MSNLYKILKSLHKINCPICDSRCKKDLQLSIKNRLIYRCSCDRLSIKHYSVANKFVIPGFYFDLDQGDFQLYISCYLFKINNPEFEVSFNSISPYYNIFTLKYLPENLEKLSSKEIINYFNNLKTFS